MAAGDIPSIAHEEGSGAHRSAFSSKAPQYTTFNEKMMRKYESRFTSKCDGDGGGGRTHTEMYISPYMHPYSTFWGFKILYAL